MFLDLFYGLRNEGVPISIQEWQMFMPALERGLRLAAGEDRRVRRLHRLRKRLRLLRRERSRIQIQIQMRIQKKTRFPP